MPGRHIRGRTAARAEAALGAIIVLSHLSGFPFLSRRREFLGELLFVRQDEAVLPGEDLVVEPIERVASQRLVLL